MTLTPRAVKLVVPHVADADTTGLVKDLANAENLLPFSQQVIEFTVRLSARLLADHEARAYPELQSLGFWMRKAEVLRLKQQFETLGSEHLVLVPRGVVFHVPPGNVDTLFIYSWILALVTGNRNVVRLSQRETPVVELLCKFVREILAQDDLAAIRAGTRFVRYGHDLQVTQAISDIADVRVLWGGDATVKALREIPLSQSAKELTFPDRWSLAAISIPAWLELADDARAALAEQFFNDSFWFNQLACSSPRLVLFCGDPGSCREVRDGFFAKVAEVARSRKFHWETGTVLEKILFTYRAVLDRKVTEVRTFGNELTVLQLQSLDGLARSQPGGGLFFSAHLDSLQELAPHVDRRDQTLAVFGFAAESLQMLVQTINGKGLDRIVPIGHALRFHRYWDGYDLLQEFTKCVHIDIAREG